MPPKKMKDTNNNVAKRGIALKGAPDPNRPRPKAGAKDKEVEKVVVKSKHDKISERKGLSKEETKVKSKKAKNDKRAEREKRKDRKKKKKEDNGVYKPRRKRLNKFQRMFASTPDIIIRDPLALEAIDGLGLTQKHLKKLRGKFDDIDIDGSGNIDTEEFFEACGETRSPITDRLFAIIDLDSSGTIEFEEFIRVLATYCMFTKDDILRFCFETFDKDGSNAIDEQEFVDLCKHVNNASPTYPGNFKNALENFDVNEDGLIDYAEFIELERRYPLILFPAFRLQDSLQSFSLGANKWLKIIEEYTRMRKIEEYKALHGGKAPPEPWNRRWGKAFCPCLYKEKVHIKLGAEMEARHQATKK
jgi:Ca2+-binding EF-hand superfamily protein